MIFPCGFITVSTISHLVICNSDSNSCKLNNVEQIQIPMRLIKNGTDQIVKPISTLTRRSVAPGLTPPESRAEALGAITEASPSSCHRCDVCRCVISLCTFSIHLFSRGAQASLLHLLLLHSIPSKPRALHNSAVQLCSKHIFFSQPENQAAFPDRFTWCIVCRKGAPHSWPFEALVRPPLHMMSKIVCNHSENHQLHSYENCSIWRQETLTPLPSCQLMCANNNSKKSVTDPFDIRQSETPRRVQIG